MSEPLKPRIDFAEPLKEEPTSAFKAQQTFSEAESRTFAPAAIDERPEDEGAAEAAVDAALRPKRSLWRKMVMGGLALFGASVVGQGVQWTMNAWQTQDWVALGGCAAGALIVGAGVGSVVTEWRRLWRLRQRAHERDEARELLHSHSVGKGRAFCEKLAQQAGIDQSHPALQRWYAAIHETQNDREIVGLYANLVQPVLDAQARREISRFAAESTLMIAVSPLALVDMAFIAWRNLRLINRIATLYGIELGYYSRLRLFRLVLLNIAFAGASELVREVGMDYFLMEITPVHLQNENDEYVLTGAVVMLRSTIRMGQQLQNLSTQDLSAFSQIIAVSAKMKHVVEQARKLAMLSAPLLITGDTGTGKDLFAYACHQASPRSAKPYLALNCASIPEDAVESELFGHAPEGKKGFFEQANGGSVLLDEIGEMSPRMQAKLLRFLNDGTFRRVGEDHEIHVDVRVICATQKNLVELVQKGLFREDLYYRLNVLTLNLPPLRDCPQDIMPLTELFVARFADEQGVPRPKLSADLSTVLTRYGWPGNVRQLKNAIYRALTQLEGYELRPQDILLPDYDAATVAVGEDAMEGSLDDITSRFERSVLTQLYRSYPSTRKLAKRLGVSHTAIANKLREYGLSQKKGEE